MTKSSIIQSLYNVGKKYAKSATMYAEIYSNVVERNGNKISSFTQNIRQTFEVKNELDKYLFSPNKTDHIILNDIVDNPDYRGKFFVRQEANKKLNIQSSSLREVKKGEIESCKILAIGGLDFDTPLHISALLKFTKVLAAKGKYDLTDSISIAVFPEVSRKERYDAAIKFSEDDTFYPKYIEDRVKKYFIPRLMDEDTIFNMPGSYSIVSFSVGGREVLMIETALKNILKYEHGVDEKTIGELMSCCTAVCVGYAVSPSSLSGKGFNKLIIFSEDDHGVLLPGDLIKNVLIKENLTQQKNFLVTRLDSQSTLIVTGHKASANQFDKDTLDHTLQDYLNCIESLPQELQVLIGESVFHYNTNNTTD